MICLNSCRKLTIGFVAVVLILATGIYVGLNMLTPAPRETAPENIARSTIEAFLSIRLPDTQGVSRRVGDWKEKVLVVNFWRWLICNWVLRFCFFPYKSQCFTVLV